MKDFGHEELFTFLLSNIKVLRSCANSIEGVRFKQIVYPSYEYEPSYNMKINVNCHFVESILITSSEFDNFLLVRLSKSQEDIYGEADVMSVNLDSDSFTTFDEILQAVVLSIGQLFELQKEGD